MYIDLQFPSAVGGGRGGRGGQDSKKVEVANAPNKGSNDIKGFVGVRPLGWQDFPESLKFHNVKTFSRSLGPKDYRELNLSIFGHPNIPITADTSKALLDHLKIDQFKKKNGLIF